MTLLYVSLTHFLDPNKIYHYADNLRKTFIGLDIYSACGC